MGNLGEEIVKKYITRVQGDKKLREIAKTIRNGGNYGDAENYATRAGEVLSEVFRENITADNFPVGSVDEIAEMVIPAIKMNYEANSQAVELVQKSLNTAGGIGMNAIPTEFDEHAAMNIVGRMANYDSFEDAEWMLDEPMVTNSLSTVDKSLHKNADFQYKSGLKPKIVRTCESDACEWCQDLEGEYDYEEVRDYGNPVFQRHNNCACEITYEPGDGRVQDVVSRDWLDKDAAEERKQVANRLAHKQIISDSNNRNKRVSRAITAERYDARLKEFNEVHFTSDDADLSIIDPETLSAINEANSTQALREVFDLDDYGSSTFFDSSFSDLPLDTEKEVCRGIAYMNSLTGVSNDNVQLFCKSMNDYGKIRYYDNGYARITLNSSLKLEDAFITTIHEYAHLYDFQNGEIASETIRNIFSRLGITENEQMYIRQCILPYESDDYKQLQRDDELFAYSVERIATERYSTEVADFMILLKKEIGE